MSYRQRSRLMKMVVGAALAVEASAAMGERVAKWSQPPDPAQPSNLCYGWSEDSTFWDLGPTVADDFVCENADPVTHIRWWGTFRDWKNPWQLPLAEMPLHFHIRFWTDVPGDAADPESFSHPGRVIHEINPADFTYLCQFAGWEFDPQTGQYEASFVFDLELEPWQWFFQEPTSEPTIYWLSISACYG
jgi:hypothetical protein